AALTSKQGTLSPLAGLPITGAIFWVSTNNSKMRLIGGQENTSAYAAFVTPNGTVAPIANLPSGQNFSVAINAKGAGILGGTSLSLPYAALLDRYGRVKTIKGLPSTAGIIYNATLNESGTGLIAGFSTAGPYGSFISPDGSLTPLKGLPIGNGFLDGAALHPTGIALVGGVSFNAPFAAIVAPNGKLTYLSGLPSSGEINSTAFSLLKKVVPQSIGPFESLANTQFTLTNVLTQHNLVHRKNLTQECCCFGQSDSLFENPQAKYSMWITPFANYSRTKSHYATHSFSNRIGGVLLGFDYNGLQNIVLGGGLAYAKNRVNYHQNNGNAILNHESALLYATWERSNFYLNAALWSGISQTNNRRHSFASIVSKSQLKGWNISPHLELSYLFSICQCDHLSMEPFLTLDWMYNSQSHFREHGSSGFNIKLNHQNSSIFRTEIGCRLYSTFQYKYGIFIFEEKLSYVNKSPTCKAIGTASFIGAASTFDVTTFDPIVQNLGNAQLHVEFIPLKQDLYLSLDYQGEFGSYFQSHLITLSLGRNF
ncbi:MAG: autotransporter outer membrane beta-barrel domain-containing protein, partial [Parachlamydiaceae bacterium]|nr:autotransporter outer membrane beta-barrel domain-containing protein [Parachlamydiaceae bacterium]